jgi:hypothetical protein
VADNTDKRLFGIFTSKATQNHVICVKKSDMKSCLEAISKLYFIFKFTVNFLPSLVSLQATSVVGETPTTAKKILQG